LDALAADEVREPPLAPELPVDGPGPALVNISDSSGGSPEAFGFGLRITGAGCPVGGGAGWTGYPGPAGRGKRKAEFISPCEGTCVGP
jgi:hypothetical protein